MGTVMSISIVGDERKCGRRLAGLVERLRAVGKVERIRRVRGGVPYDSEINLPVTDSDALVEFGNNVDASQEAIIVDMVFAQPPGVIDGFTINCYGDKYFNGYPARDNGNIRCTVNPYQRQLRKNKSALAPEMLDLFSHICGIGLGYRKTDVLHGTAYLEYGCPSPAGASMIYHAKINEVARDFMRIYEEYAQGVPSLYRHRDNETPKTNQDNVDTTHHFYDWLEQQGMHGITTFLNRLTETRARKLSGIPEDRLIELLLSMSLDTIHLDFPGDGILMATDPFSTLWEIYDRIDLAVL